MGRFRAFIVAAFVWLAAAPSRAQVVAPLPESNFTVMNGANPPQVVVPLRPLQGVRKVTASVRRVTLNDVPRPTPLVGFVAKYVDADRQLLLSIDEKLRSGLTIGVYRLSVELVGEPPEAEGAPRPAKASPGLGSAEPKLVTQVLELELHLPPARLAPIPPIKLSYERGFGEDVPGRSISLTELSGVTTLTALSVGQAEPATNGDWQTDARFEASRPTPALGAGESVALELVGHQFPLGLTKGQLVVSARELEYPVIVTFEVKARAYSWFIIPLFLAGGLMGWLVRFGLRRLEARAVLEAKLAPLLQKVERAKKVAAAQLQSSLGAAQQAVAEALQGSDQAALEARVAALQSALDAAVATHASAISDGFKAAAALAKVLSTPWDLPQGTSELFAGARSLVARAEAALVADDVAGAETAIAAARTRITHACGVVGEWIAKTRPRMAELVTPSTPLALPATARASTTTDAARAAEKLNAAATFDPAAFQPATYAAGAEGYLREAHVAHGAVRQLARTLYHGFWVAANEAVSMLRKAGKPDVELSKLSAALELKLPDDPADAIEVLCTAVRQFADDLGGVIAAKTAEAKRLLQTGDYVGAMRASAVLKGMEAQGLQISSVAAAAPATPPAAMRIPRDLPPATGQTYVLQRPPPSDPIVFTQARLEKVQFLRGVVSATLLALATWIFYRDAWVGTLGDVTAVAVVAFFSDFTLDAVLGTLEKLRKAV